MELKPSEIQLLDQIKYKVVATWSSEKTNHSAMIHSDQLSNPETRGCFVSISHCPLAGGYAWITKPWQVGFDLEVSERVTHSIAERVSSPQELAKAPGPHFLWAAKEATFKSLLGPHQPDLMTQVTTQFWFEDTPDHFTFRWHLKDLKEVEGFGRVKIQGRLTLGFALFKA